MFPSIVVGLGVLAAACGGAPGSDESSSAAGEAATAGWTRASVGDVCPSYGNAPLQTVLAPPLGQSLSLSPGYYYATGVQIYTCQATSTGGHAWVFSRPQANLYGRPGGPIVGKHFLSNGNPTWQANDGSSVSGAKVASAPELQWNGTTNASAIPQLLLKAVAHTGTSSGPGTFGNVTSVQRLMTTGGVAPATGCDASHVGVETSVSYAATYYFYLATPSGQKDVVCGGTYGPCTSNAQCNGAEGYTCRVSPYDGSHWCDDGTGMAIPDPFSG
jgi:hypothetical protein